MTKGSSIFLSEKSLPHFKSLTNDEHFDVENNRKMLKIQRESFAQELIPNLRKIDTDVHELKSVISLDLKNVSLHYFKDVMKTISDRLGSNDNIINLRQKELLEQEKLLVQELKLCEQAVFDVNSEESNRTNTSYNYKPLDTHVNLPESISKFDKFLLKCGGLSGGWKAEDHQLFLQLKSKHTPEQVADLLHHKLPDISREQVLEHDAWYKQYLSLLHSKKMAVEGWKSSKKSGISQSVGNIEELCRVETPSSNSSTVRSIRKRSDAEIKKQIAEWKLAKSERLQEEEEKRKQEVKKKLAMEKEKQEIKIIQKQRLAEYLSCNLETQLHQKELLDSKKEEEKRNKARKANIMIQVFRRQDETRTQSKLDRQKQLAKSRMENERRLSRVKSEVKNIGRDPRRVMAPTVVWKNRITGEESESTRDVAFITQVPRLKVPDWRQDIKFQN